MTEKIKMKWYVVIKDTPMRKDGDYDYWESRAKAEGVLAKWRIEGYPCADWIVKAHNDLIWE